MLKRDDRRARRPRRTRESFRLQRWINLADARLVLRRPSRPRRRLRHYASPTQGVAPADMMRHILGEDLNVGCVLTWGPCWYHQKQFFDGRRARALDAAAT